MPPGSVKIHACSASLRRLGAHLPAVPVPVAEDGGLAYSKGVLAFAALPQPPRTPTD